MNTFKFRVVNLRTLEGITLTKRTTTITRGRDLAKASARKTWGQGTPVAVMNGTKS